MFFRCVNCGGNVVYDPQAGRMKCLSCGGTDCEEKIPAAEPSVCVNCGTQIPYKEFTSATKCPSCGTYIIRDDKVTYPYGADLVLPFKLGKRDAEERLKEEFGRKLFLPPTFLSHKTLENLRGMYVPFWLYDFDSDVDYHAVGTKVRKWSSGNTDYTETSYFNVHRRMHVTFQRVPADASIEMNDKVMDLMEPYAYEGLCTHDDKFLSGFEGETYNFTPEQLLSRAEKKVDDASMGLVRDSASQYTSLQQEGLNTVNTRKGQKFALLPVWVYEYRYMNQNYIFYVNGQTGKCVGAPPLSKTRAFALTAILGGSLFAFVNGICLLLGVL